MDEKRKTNGYYTLSDSFTQFETLREKLSRVILDVNASQAYRHRDGKLFVGPKIRSLRITTRKQGDRGMS